MKKDPENPALKARLSEEQYCVTQCGGTERPFTGAYWNTKTAGMYQCVVCGAALFSSEAKYDSGTGWPSFYAPASAEAIGYNADNGHGMRRVEVVCRACNAHLGHVFDDGPAPTGQRFCINSASLELKPE